MALMMARLKLKCKFRGLDLTHTQVNNNLWAVTPPSSDPTSPHTKYLMNTSFSRLSRQPLHYLRLWPVHPRSNKQTRRLNSQGAFPPRTYRMTAAESTLAETLRGLSLTTPLPKYPNCYPEVNPVDVYRSHLTSILTEVTGVDAAIIYPALQWTQTLEKGDLVLPIPALRVKGKKPAELAAEWVAKVFNPHKLIGQN
jgi:hypothetical protein